MRKLDSSVSYSPSTKGCRACRKSRVKLKCSGEHLRCARCARRDISCHYPDTPEFSFRNENDKVALRARALWRQRVTLVNFYQPPSALRNAQENLQNDALAIFFRDFGCYTFNPWLTFFQMLPSLYQNPTSNASCTQAIRALALAYRSFQQHGITQLEIMARIEYSKAIKMTRRQLLRHNEMPNTDMIAAISLMGLFETILPSPCQKQSWQTHQQGAICLILPNAQSHASVPGISPYMLNFLYLLMTVTCLNLRSRPRLPLHLWTNMLDPDHPTAVLFPLMYQLAQWQTEIDECMEKGTRLQDPAVRKVVTDMITTLATADQALERWAAGLPPSFAFTEKTVSHDSHVILQWSGFSRRTYVYQNPWNAISRTFGFAVRIMLNLNLLECSRWLASRDLEIQITQQTHHVRAVRTITEMIGHIFCSVDAVISFSNLNSPHDASDPRVGTFMQGRAIVWPLSVVRRVLQQESDVFEGVGPDQAQRTNNALQYIRDLFGSSLSPEVD